MLERPCYAREAGRVRVLNAFRHLICWNGLRIVGGDLGVRCSTPFGILYVGTPTSSSPNALTFWCSTPFGILYVGTAGQAKEARMASSAQRLSASYMLEPQIGHVPFCVRGVLNAFRHLICWNSSSVLPCDQVRDVLNAFRHLICWNADPWSAKAGGGRCSTPFGILYVGTR